MCSDKEGKRLLREEQEREREFRKDCRKVTITYEDEVFESRDSRSGGLPRGAGFTIEIDAKTFPLHCVVDVELDVVFVVVSEEEIWSYTWERLMERCRLRHARAWGSEKTKPIVINELIAKAYFQRHKRKPFVRTICIPNL